MASLQKIFFFTVLNYLVMVSQVVKPQDHSAEGIRLISDCYPKLKNCLKKQ